VLIISSFIIMEVMVRNIFVGSIVLMFVYVMFVKLCVSECWVVVSEYWLS